MHMVNLTPHDVNVYDTDGLSVTAVYPAPAKGTEARCFMQRVVVYLIGDIPVYASVAGEVLNLPAPVEGTVYITSALVRTHKDVAHRTDVVSPADIVRDPSNPSRTLGCRSFDMNAVEASAS